MRSCLRIRAIETTTWAGLEALGRWTSLFRVLPNLASVNNINSVAAKISANTTLQCTRSIGDSEDITTLPTFTPTATSRAQLIVVDVKSKTVVQTRITDTP